MAIGLEWLNPKTISQNITKIIWKKKSVKCHEEPLEGHAKLEGHQCLQSVFAGTLRHSQIAQGFV